MVDTNIKFYQRRVYPLDARELTEEQIAVAFAMTSRRPEPFDQIAQQVSQEKAAHFHERWVLGYGHASVAEHAVVHLAVENISRLACDTLEDNRLASYTEKSSRYQVMPPDYYYVPPELLAYPDLKRLFKATCATLFAIYQKLIDGCITYLEREHPQRLGEKDAVYYLRLRREATDVCRSVLPSATLTNVGVTTNARVLEHAISKLLSSDLEEERELGDAIREQGKKITPTLIKYTDANPYLEQARKRQQELSERLLSADQQPLDEDRCQVRLVDYDRQAEEKLAAALLYRHSNLDYQQVWRRVADMDASQRQSIIGQCLEHLGPHDAPVREFELVSYTFEFLMDYGAYREFKRHRMQSYVPQALTVANGYHLPGLLAEAGLQGQFEAAMEQSEAAYWRIHQVEPLVAQYVATHAHYRRVLSAMNLRECYHLFKLRTSREAHESIRLPMKKAMQQVVELHPHLFKGIQLRDYPGWWPFP